MDYLLIGIVYAFSAAVQPGPLSTYLINQALARGWRHTLPACLSPVLSDGPIIILVLFLLSRVPSWLINLLHFGGAAFIFYLAFSTIIDLRKDKAKTEVVSQSSNQTLFKAAFVNLLNPAPYIGWSLVMGPLFMKGYNESPVNGIALLISFYVMLAVTLAAIIFLFDKAGRVGLKVTYTLRAVSIAALFGFGFYQLWLGINSVG